MTHGKYYSKECERELQYSKIINKKYNNPTLFRLRRKAAKSIEEKVAKDLEVLNDSINFSQKNCEGTLKKFEKNRKKIIDSCPIDPEITYLISRGWSVDKYHIVLEPSSV